MPARSFRRPRIAPLQRVVDTHAMRKSYSLWRCSGFAVLVCLPLTALLSQSPDDDKAIRAAVEGYLTARDWKARLPFIEDASKHEAAMQAKYQGLEFQLQNPSVQKAEAMDNLPGNYLVKATWSEKAKIQNFAGY